MKFLAQEKELENLVDNETPGEYPKKAFLWSHVRK
jgi:hypothetical protein